MIEKVFMQLSLLDGEKLRVAMDGKSVLIQSLRTSFYDEPEEWRTIHWEKKSDKGLENCVERASLYALATQKELAKEAFHAIA